MNRADAKRIAIAAALKCEEITLTQVRMEGGPPFMLISRPIRAKATKLRARWTCDLQQTLTTFFSRKAEKRLTKLLAAELASEVDNFRHHEQKRRQEDSTRLVGKKKKVGPRSPRTHVRVW